MRNSRSTCSHGADTHVYVLEYEYDLNGRRTKLIHPDNLTPSGAGDQLYFYASHGALGSIQNIMDNVYNFSYDAESRLTTLAYPGGNETRTYDDDGRLLTRYDRSVDEGAMHHDTLTYDRRDRTRTASSLAGALMGETVESWYSGLGSVIATDVDYTWSASRTVEEFRSDAVGSVEWRRVQGSVIDPEHDYTYQSGSGRLNKLISRTPAAPPEGWKPDTTYNTFDGSGNVKYSGRRVIVPHANWRGGYDSGTDTTGTEFGDDLDWPAEFRMTYHNSDPTGAPPQWLGSLIQDKRDATG